MEDLFTFNSQQLQGLTGAKKSEIENKNHPQFRKRILSKASSKKIERSASSQSESGNRPLTSRRSQKKVTFHFGDRPSIRKESLDDLMRNRIPQSAVITRKSNDLVDYRSSQLKKSEHQYILDRPIRKLVKRVFSTVEPSRKSNMEEEIRIINKINQSPIIASKRPRTAKMNSKVMIDISNQKLPEPFRVKFGERFMSKIKLGANSVAKPSSDQNMTKSCHKQNSALSQLERFKMLLHRENKLISKLSARSK